MKIKLRTYINDKDGGYFTIQGTPDLETLSSFTFHYYDSKHKYDLSTQCKDCKGNELFGNDIVLWKSGNQITFQHDFICKIVFDHEEFNGWALECEGLEGLIPLGKYGAKLEDIELIGNVYQK
jgi:hypothetical protein